MTETINLEKSKQSIFWNGVSSCYRPWNHEKISRRALSLSNAMATMFYDHCGGLRNPITVNFVISRSLEENTNIKLSNVSRSLEENANIKLSKVWINLKYSLFLFLASTSVLRYFYFYISTCVGYRQVGLMAWLRLIDPVDPTHLLTPGTSAAPKTQQAANPIELTWP
jgi:hypothetical protein